MESTVKLYSLNYSETRTYLTALIFVAGNVVLPQLFHLFPSGGTTWLPIYFFTLIGAYKYGWKAGLLTAIASPLVNSWLFGMPAPAVLPAILMKSLLLAAGAGYVAHRSKHVSILLLLAVVAFYQLAGTFDGMLESLEQAFLRERQFTSDVSHELRTPVSVILAQCEASLNRTDLSEEQRKEILLIRKKAGEMSQMISQLLLLSRADQGRQQLNKEEINISELTEIIVEEQKMLAQRRKIEVHTEIEPDITGYLDESFYIRMLDNLISNAVSYGKEGGNIKVTLHQIPSGVQGTVEDDGIGISRDDQVHIWERFYRVDASRTGKEEGSHSGLGLSMVKWIAQAHGGNVRVESELGKGSCFTFELKF